MYPVLKIKDFRYLIVGTMLSNAAQWIQQVTISWLVYEITLSGTILGTVSLVRGLASFFVIPFVGWLIDKLERKRLIMYENSLLFASTFLLAILLIIGRCGFREIFVFSIVAGICQTLDFSLRQVLVFDVVPRELAPNALALVQTGWAIMRSLGPALGGFLILWFGPGGNFLVQAVMYVLITFTFFNISFPSRRNGQLDTSFWSDLREGVKFVLSSSVMRTFTLLGLTIPLLVIPVFTVLTPIFTKDIFKAGPDSLGVLMSSVGFGGMIGGVMVSLMQKFPQKGVLQCVALFFLGISLTIFSFCKNFRIALIFFALAGLLEMVVLVMNQTILQMSIPDEIRGRVTTIVNLNMTLAPVAGLLVGILKDKFGTPMPVSAGMGVMVAIVGLSFCVFSSTVKGMRLEVGPTAKETTRLPSPL